MTIDQDFKTDLHNQLLTLWVNDQLFGIPVLYVKDIFKTSRITPVPLTGPEVSGVANLRGRVVTVLDLRYILSGMLSDSPATMNIAVEWNNELYSFMVDSVSEVLKFSPQDLEKTPSTLDEKLRELTNGIYKLKENLLLVLDVKKILTSYEKTREEK
jgi:purine-binding chemotaxis protein CheW